MFALHVTRMRRLYLNGIFIVALGHLLFALPASSQVLNNRGGAEQADGANLQSDQESSLRQRQSVEVFGDWSLQCVSRGGVEDCFAETRIRQTDDDGQGRDLVLLRFRANSEGLRASLQLPNGVLLNAPAELIVGELVIGTEYVVCRETRCLAQADIASDFVEALEAAATLDVKFSVPGPRNLIVPVSLNGLSDVIRSL